MAKIAKILNFNGKNRGRANRKPFIVDVSVLN